MEDVQNSPAQVCIQNGVLECFSFSLKLGYRIGLGESMGDKGSEERGVITKAKKGAWYKIQGMLH